MPEKTTADLQMANDGLRLALRRAAAAIQGCYIAPGISGEATIALATAIQNDDETWQAAVARAMTCSELAPHRK